MAVPTVEAIVKGYMMQEYKDHVDPLTGELNITGLAEDALDHFPMLDGSPEADVWDWAAEVETELADQGLVLAGYAGE